MCKMVRSYRQKTNRGKSYTPEILRNAVDFLYIQSIYRNSYDKVTYFVFKTFLAVCFIFSYDISNKILKL